MRLRLLPLQTPRPFGWALALGLAGLLVACAQNDNTQKGGTTSTSNSSLTVDLDKTAITLITSQGGPMPSVTVNVRYTGATLAIGIPAGANAATWLTVVPITVTTGQGSYSVNATNTSLTPGTYTTTLRFATARTDGTGAVYVDVPVSYTITAPEVVQAGAEAPRAAEGPQAPTAPERPVPPALSSLLDRILWAAPTP